MKAGEFKLSSPLNESVEWLLSRLLKGFSVHPLMAPFLHTSKDDPPKHFLHQHEVIARLAPRHPIRAFLADEIGLGKTVIAISIAKCLEAMGRACRILIAVPRVLVLQWRKELIRMGIPSSKIRHLERWTIRSLETQAFPDGYYIASMDLLKRERHLERVIEAPWDLIIVDEAHRFGYKTKRFFNIGKRLVEAYPDRHVLFLSATPHRGDARDYLERLKLIDPYLGEWGELDNRTFYEATHSAVLFRRTKDDVNSIYEDKQIFPRARFYACLVKASELENKFVEELVTFLRSKLIEFAYEKGLISEKVIPLLTVLIFKRASSCPYSAYTTLQRLLARRAGVDEMRLRELVASIRSFFKTGYDEYEYDERDPEEVFNEFLEESSALLSEEDVAKIEQLRDMAKTVMETRDTKLDALCRLLEWIIENGFKAVVFTEYKDTLKYLYEQLQHRHREWEGHILTLSADETRDESRFQYVKERFEKDPKVWLLIATDVVAEGVNLQVANILINYEIPWSLVKLEQRIGRVWRLGQQREVEAYTVFMDNVADEAALNSMYVKLVNLRRAELKPRPFTGEEILWYSEGEEIYKAQPVMLEEKREKKAFRRVTEFRTIQTYIREGKAGLERLIERILAARQEIERELRSKSILHLPKTREEAERAPKALGFGNPAELMESMKNLLKSACPFLGLRIEDEGDIVRVARGHEMATVIRTLDDFFGFLKTGKGLPATIVSYGDFEDELLLAKLTVKCGDSAIYSEPIGIYVEQGKVVRGADLINDVSAAISRCLGASQAGHIKLTPGLKAMVSSHVKRALSTVLAPLSSYRERLMQVGLRDADSWADELDFEVELSDPFCTIRFVKTPIEKSAEPSEEVKREVEEEAIRIALKIEGEEGRKAVRVPDAEHYDIKSIDPQTGDVRKIEVKGHAYGEVYAELTEPEAELARKEGPSYWLYIVYDIKGGSPKILRFNDPLNTMNWKILEKVERRHILWPKMGSCDGDG